MGDMKDFANRMRKRASQVEDKVNLAVVNLAMDIVTQVAEDTPIRSGRAQSNWITSVGGPVPYYKENPFMNNGAQESIDMARTMLSGYNGGVIHIVNNVSYIAQLNAGSSRQAPALFVQSAILRATYKFKRVKLNL